MRYNAILATDDGTYEEASQQIHSMAVDAFAGHVIEQKGPGEWRCARPGTNVYSFNIISRPGMLVFYGDIGEFVLRAYDRDMVSWVGSAVRSPGYFQEKIAAGERSCFYIGDAKALVEAGKAGDENCGLTKEMAEKIDEAIIAWDELNQRDWWIACQDAGDDEPASCDGLSAGALWFLEAMRWFTGKLAEHTTHKET